MFKNIKATIVIAVLVFVSVNMISCTAGRLATKKRISSGVGLTKETAPVGWRNDGTGVYPKAEPVTEWTEDKNVVWRAKVGGSHSSPVIAGDKVFVTSEPDLLICVDKLTGKLLWEKTSSFEDMAMKISEEDAHPPTNCGYATPTPVTDGKFIYAVFGTGIVSCFDFKGNRKWSIFRKHEYASEDGRSASPVIYKNKLIVSVEYLAAIDVNTGKILWESKEAGESFGTPIIARINNTDILITPQGDVVDPSDGKVLAKAIGAAIYSSPVADNDVVYFSDRYSTAIKLSITGKEVKHKELWETELEESNEIFSSPVVRNGYFHAICANANYYAIDASTGEIVVSKRLEGLETNVYGSVAIAGKYLFLGDGNGSTIVLEHGSKFKQVSKIDFEYGLWGTYIFSGKQMFCRYGDYLYCIGK